MNHVVDCPSSRNYQERCESLLKLVRRATNQLGASNVRNEQVAEHAPRIKVGDQLDYQD